MFKVLKNDLDAIAPNLDFTDFLVKRIQRNDYRGTHKLQHYRWDVNYIKIVLNQLSKIKDKLYHTTGDVGINYKYTEKEIQFGEFLSAVNLELRKIDCSVSDNAMRKIIFVNLQRMGLIDRFDKNKNICEISKTYKNYRYVKLTQKGKEFLSSKNLFELQRNLGSALDFAFGGVVQDIMDIINSFKQNEAYLSVYEMMFFVTFLGKEMDGIIINKDIILEFINEFRSLKARQKTIIKRVEIFCNPKDFSGNKICKRDFHNWKNETQTMFNSLELMSYFEYDKANERLLLRTNIAGNCIKFKRSSLIKNEYFKNHEVTKDIRFELHHIIPFYFAKDLDELKAIDNWQNLIYIDANSHKLFTLNKNSDFIRLNFNANDAVLDNFLGDKIILQNIRNIKYKISLQKQMIKYNKGLI